MKRSCDFPVVSVILPTYNRAYILSRAIQSVLNQTYSNFELIVIDDASTDNTERVVLGFKDSRIRYIRHEENKGGAAARNTGIRYAEGDLIAFQDSDDEWLPPKLEKQVGILQEASAEVGVVYSGFWKIGTNKRVYIPSANIIHKEGNVHVDLLKNNFVGTPAAVIRRECFEKAGAFDERLPRLQDWDLFIRVSRFYEFRYIDEPLLISYLTHDSISTKPEALIKALELILDKHLEDFRRHKRSLAHQQYRLANLFYQYGEAARGRDYLLRAVRTRPADIKYLAAALVSLLGKGPYTKMAGLKRLI